MKKFIGRLFAVITAAAVAAASAVLPAAAESDFGERDKNGIPMVTATELKPFDILSFSGKYDLFENSCYFAEKTMVLKRDITVPESSMLVVRNGINLKIGAGVTLTVNGTLAVHSGSKLNVMKGGSLVLGDSSVSVISTLAVSRGGNALAEGYAQCASVNVKGALNVSEGGTLTYEKNKIYSGGKASGITKAEGAPRYVVWELDAAAENDIKLTDTRSGQDMICNDVQSKRDVIRSFESVLYRYNGKIQLPISVTAAEFQEELGYVVEGEIQSDEGVVRFGTTPWLGVALVDRTDNERVLEGSFYSVVKGCTEEFSMADIIYDNNTGVGIPSTIPSPPKYDEYYRNF